MDQLFQEACYLLCLLLQNMRPSPVFSKGHGFLWTLNLLTYSSFREREGQFLRKMLKKSSKIFLWLFWWSPNENENAKWGDVGRLAKTALDVIREKQKEICNFWTKTIKRYISLKSFVLHQDKTPINQTIPGKKHCYLKHCKNCESCPAQVTWKVNFKCQICLSCVSCLSCLSCLSHVSHCGYHRH